MNSKACSILNSILTNDKLTTLKKINLSWGNGELFKSEECVDLLSKIITKQNGLTEVSLGWNDLSSSVLARILSTIRASPSLSTIETLKLAATHWNGQEACEQLANLLAKASALKEV